jgi:hypothetical protein
MEIWNAENYLDQVGQAQRALSHTFGKLLVRLPFWQPRALGKEGREGTETARTPRICDVHFVKFVQEPPGRFL